MAYDEDAIAAEPHYHAWTLRAIPIDYGQGFVETELGYIPEVTPYPYRMAAWRQLPRYDADRYFGKDGGRVLKCWGRPACPFYYWEDYHDVPYPVETDTRGSRIVKTCVGYAVVEYPAEGREPVEQRSKCAFCGKQYIHEIGAQAHLRKEHGIP